MKFSTRFWKPWKASCSWEEGVRSALPLKVGTGGNCQSQSRNSASLNIYKKKKKSPYQTIPTPAPPAKQKKDTNFSFLTVDSLGVPHELRHERTNEPTDRRGCQRMARRGWILPTISLYRGKL